jgi:hypothetical protein
MAAVDKFLLLKADDLRDSCVAILNDRCLTGAVSDEDVRELRMDMFEILDLAGKFCKKLKVRCPG